MGNHMFATTDETPRRVLQNKAVACRTSAADLPESSELPQSTRICHRWRAGTRLLGMVLVNSGCEVCTSTARTVPLTLWKGANRAIDTWVLRNPEP